MAGRRLFIGLEILQEARDMIAGYIARLRKGAGDVPVGWEKPEKLHVTLKFLGNVDDAVVGDIQSMLTAVARRHALMRADISTTGVFPNSRAPRVLWLGIHESSGDLIQLRRDIETHSGELGFAIEDREFRPHLTIARIREPQKSRDLAALHLEQPFGPLRFEMSEILLYESRLRPQGSQYSVVSRHRLFL